MFKLEKPDTFKWPVQVRVPRDGGTFATHEFTAEFKLLDQGRLDASLEKFRTDDQDLLGELLVGWSGVQDSNGDALTFTEDSKQQLLAITYVRTGLLTAYFDATSGNKAKRGN